MKKKIILFLAAEAVLCIVLQFLLPGLQTNYLAICAFPFAQIGTLLRTMSLAGTAGNIAAWALYLLICLLPAGYAAYRAKKELARKEDALLLLLSVVLLVAMYRLINPFLLVPVAGAGDFAEYGKIFLGGTIYCILIGYLVIRILRNFTGTGMQRLLNYLFVIAVLACVVLVFNIFFVGFSALRQALREFQAANTMGGPLGLSLFFIAVQHLVGLLPAALEIAIVFKGFALMDALKDDAYSEQTVSAAKSLAGIAKKAVVETLLAEITVNVAQMLLHASIRSSHYMVSIPLDSILFMVMAYLLAKIFEQGKQIKDDNALFV
ncbi:hypothetical protein LJC07_01950 [Christensenellaceae bacterium OttesenSCG-928-L17]|nr:hypothetical protein [Christensenellaceae bacterium OttesenSCG-928-L17]